MSNLVTPKISSLSPRAFALALRMVFLMPLAGLYGNIIMYIKDHFDHLGYDIVTMITCPTLKHNSNGSMYVVLSCPMTLSDWMVNLSPTMKFTIKDCDPMTGEPESEEGYDDEYALEDVEIRLTDFMQKSFKVIHSLIC